MKKWRIEYKQTGINEYSEYTKKYTFNRTVFKIELYVAINIKRRCMKNSMKEEIIMLRVNNIKLKIDHTEEELTEKLLQVLKILQNLLYLQIKVK
jgi:hypothetical protein